MTRRISESQLSLFADTATTAPQHRETQAEPPRPTCGYDHTRLFERLAQSAFRSRFHLKAGDRAYIDRKGWQTVCRHAEEMIAQRLAPAFVPNDGHQTPMRGHPVFVAQHATACCCRGCLEKWHHIPSGRPLTAEEQRYVVSVVTEWIRKEYNE